jgi:hypothetical protein
VLIIGGSGVGVVLLHVTPIAASIIITIVITITTIIQTAERYLEDGLEVAGRSAKIRGTRSDFLGSVSASWLLCFLLLPDDHCSALFHRGIGE